MKTRDQKTALHRSALDGRQKYFRYVAEGWQEGRRSHGHDDFISSRKEQNDMAKLVNASSAAIIVLALAGGAISTTTPVAAAPMSDADKAAMKKASDTCKAQVKEEARFNEMSWWARHKAVKKCVADKLASH
jgi:hypothetical protein